MSLLRPREWFFAGYLMGFLGGLLSAGYFVWIDDPHYFRPPSVISYYYQVWTVVVLAVVLAMVLAFVYLLRRHSPRASAAFGMMLGFTIVYYVLFFFATILLLLYGITEKDR